MEDRQQREKIRKINIIREKTRKNQFNEIYLEQERIRTAQERKKKRIEKWGYMCACFML